MAYGNARKDNLHASRAGRFGPGTAMLAAALVTLAATPQAAEAAAGCAVQAASIPADATAGADRHKIADLEAALRRNGCSVGSIIVVGSENNAVCQSLGTELAALKPASRAAADCARLPAPSHSQFRQPGTASHSQFRQHVVFGSVTELRLGGLTGDIAAPEETAALNIAPASLETGSAPKPAEPAFEHELVDLETRMAERNVRVVGPTFLPDRSEAIDLRAPGRNLFR